MPPQKKVKRAAGAAPPGGAAASRFIEAQIAATGGWRGAALARMRALIREADPAIVEEVKWRGVPVWSHDGIICTGEIYKNAVKLTFAKGASLPDPAHVFNASLDGKVRRAIDIHEGETVNARAFKALIKAAVTANAKPAPKAAKLLSGGNPQIAKGDGAARRS